MPLSKNKFSLKNDDCELVVTDHGAALISFNYRGIDYLASQFSPYVIEASQGQLLCPWPNRIKNGTYEHLGTKFQLPINEVEKRNAIHGLIRWNLFQVINLDHNGIEMTSVVIPQQGYVYELKVKVKFELLEFGFKVLTEVSNESDFPAPFGMGWHPYFNVSEDGIDSCYLQIKADSFYETDPNMIPVKLQSVIDSDFDFRQSKPIAGTIFDTCYTNFDNEAVRAILWNKDSDRQLRLFADNMFGQLMVYSGDTLKNSRLRRRSIAMEPMTCPADAFNSKSGLILIESHQSVSGEWGISLT